MKHYKCQLDPDKPVPQWKRMSALERAHMSRVFLYLHGFITDAENNRIIVKLAKWTNQESDR